MAAFTGIGLLAHGGVAGAVIEFVLVLGVAVVFVAVWLRERRAGREDDSEG